MAPHIILVCFPATGHINPTLQFAKILAGRGADATFVTTIHAPLTAATITITTNGISLAWISDGYDPSSAVQPTDPNYYATLCSKGPASLAELIASLAASGRPVDCIAYNFLLPWAADVAADHGIPSAVLWLQPASVLSIYYHFIHDRQHLFGDLSRKIHLPGLSSLVASDLPSFLFSATAFPRIFEVLSDMFQAIKHHKTKWLLVNSFDALEPKAISMLQSVFPSMAAVGPMITSPFSAGGRPNHLRGDLVKDERDRCTKPKTDDIIAWLDLKREGSVVYISFGTWAKLTRSQLDQVASWLTESEHQYFLWVVKPPENNGGFPNSFEEAVRERGMVVEWCNQTEVLAHPSVGCFVTHSGWNSTLEALVCGKPTVCLPQWSDQPTNAKLVQDVWKTGVRARCGEAGDVVNKEEIKRCVGAVMAEESGREIRENATKIKEMATQAMEEGGSTHRIIKVFINDHMPKS